MPIVHAELARNDEVRARVLADLLARKRQEPGFSVLDVGGGANAWADRAVDAYVDIVPFATDRELFLGDVCQPAVWDEVAAAVERRGRRFDFSICTHVFEDVRDPLFVARQLERVSAAGFVSMPTKHSELSHVESGAYLGYCHHRWVFTVRDETLVAVAKLPVVEYFNSRRRPLRKLLHLLGRSPLLAKAERRLGVFPAGPGVDWVDRRRAGHGWELAFRWRDGFRFDLVNGDYAGASCLELADLYREAMREGL
jgi:hypothetical protein